MNLEQAVAHLLHTDPQYKVAKETVRGIQYQVFCNAPRNLRALLEACAPAYGNADLLVYQDERWDYNAFCNDVRRLADSMDKILAVRPGDRVAIAMRNYPEFCILVMAISALGAIVVPLNAWWSGAELVSAMKDCGAKVVFADKPRVERLKSCGEHTNVTVVGVRKANGDICYTELRDAGDKTHWPTWQIDPDDDFAILYSSGSTGMPKGVVQTHRNAISAVHSWSMSREMAPLLDGAPNPTGRRPSLLVVTPLFHVTALHSNFLLGLATGSKISLLYNWDVEEAIRVIKAESVTRFVGVPLQSKDLMERAVLLEEKLETLESIGGGGAKRPASQVGELAKAFPDASISSGWGMTETNGLGITIAGPDYLNHPEAAGRLTPPLQEVRIVDEGGANLVNGEIGELVVKSPANMRCYHNQPEATSKVLRDGWLYTGDLARMDGDGLIYIVDRKKNIIIRGGENISCLEVEGAMHRHPDVIEACAFSIPDQRFDEVVGAAVYLRSDADLTEGQLVDFLSCHIAQFKLPEKIWFWSQPLLRGATGKIDRRLLREECLIIKDVGLPVAGLAGKSKEEIALQ
ncbi:class I adenylate-forming enzyme family protein [uncultured Sneathiella sp.]|jgi:acyl-CoA synthetase (AMP-forming)/AMP-acid ligase II|uniref:class I adenylate-forming enzyme family protein n=1 Tax=uncultured Sneathiella sp. TaxID=879315 RepID=UPI0030DA71AC|tara:strand:+ start:59987 stop:61714 length:1728 start_codon:yes stop_codon:yes gene_type:complete